jgi:sugar phosphate isomerase/epimerase
MKFGLCTDISNVNLAAQWGFDYIECNLSSIAALGDAEFAAAVAAVKAAPIAVERVNVMFPGSIKLIGPEADHRARDAYLEKAFARVKALGASVAVFGSGGSRRIPADYPFGKGYRELVQATKQIGAIAAKHAIMVAIEPLNRGETNVINSLREGAMLEAAVDAPSVGLLADLYHICTDNAPIEDVIAIKHFIHIHIAQPEGRRYPTAVTPVVEAFFNALAKIGYTGTMSIEAGTDDMEHDAAAALAVLRSA